MIMESRRDTFLLTCLHLLNVQNISYDAFQESAATMVTYYTCIYNIISLSVLLTLLTLRLMVCQVATPLNMCTISPLHARGRLWGYIGYRLQQNIPH